MRMKSAFFRRTKFIVGSGTSTRFWEDMWLGKMHLAIQYHSLYNIATVLQSNPLDIQFRKTLAGNRWEAWLHLVRRLIDVHLSQHPDQLHWKLTKNGVFSVKSMYLDIINSGSIPRSVHIWKVKVPLKIKVFMLVCPKTSHSH